jgi:ParB family chromosome partitioning protein
MVMLESLRPNPYPPRLRPVEDDAALAALVADIAQYGFRGAIEVRRDPADPAGHRRVAAAKRAGLTRVLAQFVDLDDDQMRQSAIRENLLRQDLTPWEEAVFLQGLRDDGLTYDGIAAYVGKSKGWIQNRLRLLTLEGPLREAAMTEPELLTVLNTLLFLAPADREALFARVKAGELNVADLRALVHAERRARERDEAAGAPGGGRRIDVPLPAPPDASLGAAPESPQRDRPTVRPAPQPAPAVAPGMTADEAWRATVADLERLVRLAVQLDPARCSPDERRRIHDGVRELLALVERLVGADA